MRSVSRLWPFPVSRPVRSTIYQAAPALIRRPNLQGLESNPESINQPSHAMKKIITCKEHILYHMSVRASLLGIFLVMFSGCATKIDSIEFFAFEVATEHGLDANVKLPFGPSGGRILHVGEDKILVSLDASDRISLEELRRRSRQMKERIDGFLAGYEQGSNNRQMVPPSEINVPVGVEFPDLWRGAYRSGFVLFIREEQSKN